MKTINSVSFEIICELKGRKHTGGDVQRYAAMQCKLNEVLVALHDAINSPKGVVPKSADGFCSHRYYVEMGDKNE